MRPGPGRVCLLAVLLLAGLACQPEAAEKPRVTLTVEVPPVVYQGDPVFAVARLVNNTDEPIKCGKPSTKYRIRGLGARVTRPGTGKDLPVPGEPGGDGVLPPRGEWTARFSVRLCGLARDALGEYVLTVAHHPTGTQEEARFKILQPREPVKELLALETRSLWSDKPTDCHKFLLRTRDGVCELLYWNDTDMFDGYLAIAQVPKGVEVKGASVDEELSGLWCYGLDGMPRTVTEAEVEAARSIKLTMEASYKDYEGTLDAAFKQYRPKHVRALVVAWADGGKLKVAAIGKLHPLPRVLTGRAWPNFDKDGLLNNLFHYSVLMPASEVAVPEPVRSVISISEDGGHASIVCESAEGKRLAPVVIDYVGAGKAGRAAEGPPVPSSKD